MKIMVAEQMERERRIQAGEELRRGIPIHEAVPGTEPTPLVLYAVLILEPKATAFPSGKMLCHKIKTR
jgi:hypothetical protein